MRNILGNTIDSELFFVYGLIALVIILIFIIILIDRKESKRKPKNLFDTLNMKVIADINNINQDPDMVSTQEMKNKEVEIIDMMPRQASDNETLEPISEVQVLDSMNINRDKIEINKESLLEDNDIYTESQLEKTQAQIRVEEITNALRKAQIEEQISEDKYTKFEEEQEKNAIISYNELKESFDKLYSESEKIQYSDDDSIPINIDELYELTNEKEKEEPKKVKLDDLSDFKKTEVETNTNTGFKNSPFISPVYGIQKPPVETKENVDSDIQNTSQFLQSLKELKNNLD